MLRLKLLAGAATVCTLLALAACSSPTPTALPVSTATPQPTTPPTVQATPTNAQTMAVTPASTLSAKQYKVTDFAFPAISVAPGLGVTWTNGDGDPHTVTSGTPAKADGRFDSPELQQGDTFTYLFEEAGQYSYFCRVHPTMTGTVNVLAATAPDYDDNY